MRPLQVLPLLAFWSCLYFGLASCEDSENDQVELLGSRQKSAGSDEEKSSDLRGYPRGRGRGYGLGAVHGPVAAPLGVVRTRVNVQRRVLRPIRRGGYPSVVSGDPYNPGFEGSYVAVSGRPGERTIHAVNGRGSVSIEPGFTRQVGLAPLAPPAVIPLGPPRRNANSLLPKCSYINTDFNGDDVGDGRGLTTGAAYECKQACIDNDSCEFWTFRRGWARDCYLKRGRRVRTQTGDNNRVRDGGRRNRNRRQTNRGNRRRDSRRPEGVIFRPGFVSGTRTNNCRCLRDRGDEVCPTRSRGGQSYPWSRANRPRFDYYDDYDTRRDYDDYDDDRDVVDLDRDVIDTGRDVEIATSTRNRNRESTGTTGGTGTGSRRNRNRDSGTTGTGGRRTNRNRNEGLTGTRVDESEDQDGDSESSGEGGLIKEGV